MNLIVFSYFGFINSQVRIWTRGVAGAIALIILAACNAQSLPLTPTAVPQDSLGREIAFISYVDGAANNVYQAYQWLREGQQIQVPPGGQVTVICQNNYIYIIQAGTDVVITDQTCQSQQPLPPPPTGRAQPPQPQPNPVAASTPMAPQSLPYNPYTQSISPDAGRIRHYRGSLELEEGARDRDSDYGRIPVIVYPRNTILANASPIIRWVGIEDAIEYELSLSALQPLPEIILDAEELTCSADETKHVGAICTFDWPTEEWLLEPDERYSLTVSARIDFAGPLRPSERSSLRTLSAEDATIFAAEQTTIEALEIDSFTRNMLLAGLYADYGLLNDAIEAYENALAIQTVPLVYVTLADLYRQIGLERIAFDLYEQAITLAEESDAAIAAAEYGIGLIHFSQDNYTEAETHFSTALDLYSQLNAAEMVVLTESALAETKARLP